MNAGNNRWKAEFTILLQNFDVISGGIVLSWLLKSRNNKYFYE